MNPKNTPITFIDSHCHLDFSRFSDVDSVIATAKCHGVTQFIVPSVDHHNWQAVLNLAKRHQAIFFALGVHPYFLSTDNQLAQLSELAQQHHASLVAIGEIGLDGAIHTPLTEQLTVLKYQLKLAKKFDLPVICHVHKAYDPLLKQLRIYQLVRCGVIHGFSGSLVQAREFIKLGFKLGIGGGVTYPRATKIKTTLSQLSLSDILLETDAPDMPLHQQQGMINTPANVALIAQVIAEIFNTSLSDVANQTTLNCQQIFRLDQKQ